MGIVREGLASFVLRLRSRTQGFITCRAPTDKTEQHIISSGELWKLGQGISHTRGLQIAKQACVRLACYDISFAETQPSCRFPLVAITVIITFMT